MAWLDAARWPFCKYQQDLHFSHSCHNKEKKHDGDVILQDRAQDEIHWPSECKVFFRFDIEMGVAVVLCHTRVTMGARKLWLRQLATLCRC